MNIFSYVDFVKMCNVIHNVLNWIKILWKKVSILLFCTVQDPLNGEKYILMNYKHVWTKLIQERIMTSKLVKAISRKTWSLLKKMKWELHVLLYIKDNISWWENISFHCVKIHPADIISIYWGLLHSCITCILSIHYIAWCIPKTQFFSMKVN